MQINIGLCFFSSFVSTATSLDQAEIYHVAGQVGSSVAGFF